MAPKRAVAMDDTGDIGRTLEVLARDVAAIKCKQDVIIGLVDEVTQLRVRLEEKEKRIAVLERRVEDLEQYSRINDVVVSGLKVKPRSYAHAVAASSDEEPGELESPEGPEGKEGYKVTKQEPTRKSERLSMKPVPPKSEAKPKKVVVKKVVDEKGVKAKKSTTRGKKEDGPAQNGDAKTNEASEAAEEGTEDKE